MDAKDLKQISKFMSLVLRHRPDKANLDLDKNGWVSISDLIDGMFKKGYNVSLNDIIYVVENNDKKRFVISDDGKKIRAAQGHSVSVDVELKKKNPPYILYHGTPTSNKDSILESGLNKGNRLYVHLSKDIETANKVATRRTKDFTIFLVDARQMVEDGYDFYISENGVWLIESVPAKYLKDMKEEEFFFFWHGKLSNWHMCNFEVDGIEYNCGEQYMMAEKARLFGDVDCENRIMKSSVPKEQKSIGREVFGFDEEVWVEHAQGIVLKGSLCRFEQNEGLKEDLLNTGKKTLVEASPYDDVWGIKLSEDDSRSLDRSKWRGKNWLGEVLTFARNKLAKKG